MSTDTVAIPPWTAQGVLPPTDSEAPASVNRSPYHVSLVDFVLHFGRTERRRAIVSGLLDFRAALHAIGLVDGFQWIDGSFLENIEAVEERDPHDVDLVTFFHSPDGADQASLLRASPRLFDPDATRERYRVDAYFVQLNTTAPETLVSQCTYWNSLWSHRRNGQWKGYLRVDLDLADDRAAVTNLDLMSNERVKA